MFCRRDEVAHERGGDPGEGTEGVEDERQVLALVGGEIFAEEGRADGEEVGEREVALRGPLGQRDLLRLGDDALVVFGAERAEVVERWRRSRWALRARQRRLVGLGWKGALDALFAEEHEHVFKTVRIVVDRHPATAEGGLDEEVHAVDLDGRRLGVDLALGANAKRVLDEDGIGVSRDEAIQPTHRPTDRAEHVKRLATFAYVASGSVRYARAAASSTSGSNERRLTVLTLRKRSRPAA